MFFLLGEVINLKHLPFINKKSWFPTKKTISDDFCPLKKAEKHPQKHPPYRRRDDSAMMDPQAAHRVAKLDQVLGFGTFDGAGRCEKGGGKVTFFAMGKPTCSRGFIVTPPEN